MKVLWLSRNELTEDQLKDLQRVYPGLEVKHYSQSVSNWKEVIKVGSDCDVLAVALPIAMLAELVKPENNTKPVIRSIGSFIPTGDKFTNPVTGKVEEKLAYAHVAWEMIENIVVETKLL